MKKTTIACIALLIMAFSAAAVERNPIDLVVVLDTSSSMYSSRKEVSEYIVGPLLTEFLKIGDTFHLLSFSDTTRSELSRRIEGPEDIETIIARLLLMYPLDPHTDFISALNDVHQYLRELPESRTKTVVIISDGEHSPKAGGLNAGLTAEETAKRIEASTARLKGNGWNFYLIKIPFSGKNVPAKLAISDTAKTQKTKALSGGEKSEVYRDKAVGTEKAVTQTVSKNVPISQKDGTAVSAESRTSSATQNESNKPIQSVDVVDVVSETLASPVVEWSKEEGSKNVGAAIGVVFAEFPTDLGKKSRSFSIPVKIRNPSASSMHLETNAVNIDGVDRMSKRSFYSLKPHSDGVIDLQVKLPDSYVPGSAKLLVAPVFTGTIRLMPDQSVVGISIKDAPFSRFFGTAAPYFIFGIGFILAIILFVIIVAFLRRSFAAPNRAAARASGGSFHAAPERKRETPESFEKAQDFKKPAGIAAANHSASTGDKARTSYPIPLPAVSASSSELSSSPGLSPRGGLPASTLIPKEPKGKSKLAAAPSFAVKKENARIMLSLWVRDQSRNIGKRNIHLMKSGATLSLGGGRSDFLVFLVPLPHHIADIHFDGEACTLVPRRPDYFPDTGSNSIENCIGKDIRVLSDKGYELCLRLEKFEDPLLKLNAFLHSIDTVGRV